jgi:hypothetical protein
MRDQINTRRDFITVTGSALIAGTAMSEIGPLAAEPAAKILHDRKFICGDGLRNVISGGKKGYAFKVRLPDYRSLPLSCIVGIELMVNGQAVDPSTIILKLAEDTFRLSQLPALHTKTWWVLDTAELFVPSGYDLKAGEHDVAGTLIFLLPYATGGSITLRSSAKKRLVLEEE